MLRKFGQVVWGTVIASIVSILCIGYASAAAINVFNTGVDASGSVVAGGTVGDLHYTMTTVPSGTTDIKAATAASEGFPIGPWLADNTLSRWIGPNVTDLDGPVGNYVYRTTFDLTGLDYTTAALSGQWSTDNTGTDILINSVSTGLSATGFTSWSTFSIVSGFVAGINTLDFLVYNAPPTGGPTGLRVEIAGEANKAPAPVPLPAAFSLLGGALSLLGFFGWRRKRMATA